MKVDYSKTFIYKLCCIDPSIKDIYVGHSTDFKSRNQSHKNDCYNINHKSYNNYKYRFIRENGGYENWIMIKLYDYPCDNKRQAEAKECESMIELGAKLNTNRPFITEEERKEQHIKSSKKYYDNNKTEISEKRKVKIKCNFCNCELNKTSLTRHQKSLNCMKFREFIDLE